MHEVVERLRAGGDAIAALAPQAFAARRGSPKGPSGDEWDGPGVLAHLLQAELVYNVRLTMVLTADQPAIVSYDQERWVARFGAVDAPGADAWLALFGPLRARLVRLLESVEGGEWDRPGLHDERGVETVAEIALHLADHDEEHLAQLRAALAIA